MVVILRFLRRLDGGSIIEGKDYILPGWLCISPFEERFVLRLFGISLFLEFVVEGCWL